MNYNAHYQNCKNVKGHGLFMSLVQSDHIKYCVKRNTFCDISKLIFFR